ncbi:kinase-like domain-containing protein [Chytriomyces sp. MP71]|nr:kinase-like domain-containing protein [Chytriomyces sp. MP71]
MATGLCQIHAKGYYHGDMKIENCLVRSNPSNPDAPSIRLTDLGHCKPVSAPIASYGTQDVSPPEFLFDSPIPREQVDGRAADVFALGMCLYLLLNADGELPRAVNAIRARMVGYQDLLSRDEGRYPLDEIADLEESAWDLLYGMCRVNPAERLTIEQVLEHKWFR